MSTTLTVLDCSVTTNLVTIVFSDDVAQTLTGNLTATSANNPANYTIFDPGAGYDTINGALPHPSTVAVEDSRTVSFSPPTSATQQGSFNPGDVVLIGISNIALASAPSDSALITSPVSVARQIPPAPGDTTGRITRDVEDAVSYPILTEEIGYRPSPVGLPTGGGGGMGGGGGRSSLGQVALQAVTDALGWKANNADPKGFVGALTQAFTLNDVEGHVQATWVPRTYAVQTDLGGGISGAQASLYMRAKDALDQSLNLLDGLYPLDPDADPEYVKALREMARSQMTEIVKEFGAVGLPSILRIDTYFNILLGQSPANPGPAGVTFEPDQIRGTLGQLRDTYGIFFANNPFNNSVADEEDITNFRVISDYMTSLMQSWIANRRFFVLAPDNLAFFGTQLVLISRQFNVIAETVNEVRFALDSVFIGPSERQTLLLEFADATLTPMFLEDVLEEVDKFVAEEGPRLLRDGGRISVTNNILPVVETLLNMVEQAHNPTNLDQLPDGFQTARVRNSLDDLDDQLEALINLTQQVEQQVPPPIEELVLAGVTVTQEGDGFNVSLLGDNLHFTGDVTISSIAPALLSRKDVTFYSAQRIDLKVHPRALDLEAGNHHITVTNPSGESVTLANAFTYDPRTGAIRAGANPTPQRANHTQQKPRGVRPRARSQRRSHGRRFPAAKNMGGRQGPISPKPPASTPGPALNSTISNPVQDLSTRHAELEKKVGAQSQQIAGIHQKIDSKIESVLQHINSAFLELGEALQEKLEQQGKQQQEQLDKKLRQIRKGTRAE